MTRPKICASIVNTDLKRIKAVEPLIDLFEVRIDLIGDSWCQVAKALKKPWIACNRIVAEGGKAREKEAERIAVLLQAILIGASIVDLELSTRDLDKMLPHIKEKSQCLLSFHDFKKTPRLTTLKNIVEKQLAAGADICKVVTTAQSFQDNLTLLKLIAEYPKARIASFAMGPLGSVSRILSPLSGGDFTYASLERGQEAAPGQITVDELRNIYQMMNV